MEYETILKWPVCEEMSQKMIKATKYRKIELVYMNWFQQ